MRLLSGHGLCLSHLNLTVLLIAKAKPCSLDECRSKGAGKGRQQVLREVLRDLENNASRFLGLAEDVLEETQRCQGGGKARN